MHLSDNLTTTVMAALAKGVEHISSSQISKDSDVPGTLHNDYLLGWDDYLPSSELLILLIVLK